MDNLRLYILSYNVSTQSPTEDVSQLLGLGPIPKASLPDFYIIGLQEVKSQPQNFVMNALFDDPWSSAIKASLAPLGYVKVKTVRLVGIVLNVFCLRRHVHHVRDMQSFCTRTGLLGLWGNKGATTLRLQIYGCSLCFLNCHMTPHDHLVQERITEYNTVLDHQKFKFEETQSILFHDYVFWFGDLNFRLDTNEGQLSAVNIEKKIKDGRLDDLLEHDQLRQVMSSGEAFSELSEEPISFPPTYRYIMNSTEFDLKRRPAWTDRILYKVNQHVYENVTLDIELQSYKSFQNYSVSDHKPIVSECSVKVFSDYSERVVRFLPIQTWYVDEVNKATISFGSDVTPSLSDWIGIFHDNFSSLDEYLSYIYVPPEPNDECEEATDSASGKGSGSGKGSSSKSSTRLELIFQESLLRSPGRYQLVYLADDSGSVLGLSAPFNVEKRDTSLAPDHIDW